MGVDVCVMHGIKEYLAVLGLFLGLRGRTKPVGPWEFEFVMVVWVQEALGMLEDLIV
jgi:hypothetical protein